MHTKQTNLISPDSSFSSHRFKRIQSIKNSLKDFDLISKNKNMIQKRLSLQFQNISQQGSSDGFSLDYEDSTIISPQQHAQIFAQKYEIISKIGQGSNGVVHHCKKKRSGMDYAVKSFGFDDEHIPQIRRNFVLVKGLTHPNIIKYQALYLDIKKHACWLVMELCEAPRLSKLQIRSQIQLKHIIQQLLQTLHYLHQRAVSHRDIKTQNILYDPINKKIKLIDYGICRKHRMRGTRFQMLTITGTLYYRAPQMFTGGGYTEKVDIWSTGILIYKLIAGHTPFESQYHSKTIENIMSAKLNLPPVFDKYSHNLKQLVIKMLRKDPRERPSALDCLRQAWFSTQNRFPMNNFIFRQDLNEQDLDCLKSPMFEDIDEASYIREINGDEFHCFDSDDQSNRKGEQKKRMKRRANFEVGFQSLTNIQL